MKFLPTYIYTNTYMRQGATDQSVSVSKLVMLVDVEICNIVLPGQTCHDVVSKVKVGNDEEMAQSKRKSRWEKTKLTIRHLY